jgi:Ca-activated chloride channel family protein
MDFLWPGLLVALALLPVLVGVYAWSQGRRRPSGVRYSSLSLLREATPGSSRLRRHLPFALFVLAVGALALGAARPVLIASVPTNQTSIILAIDVSGSMCSADVPPSRLKAAEAAAATFIQHQGSTTQIGIVAFSSFAELVQGPTTDVETLLAALGSLETGRRTAIGSGILTSIDAIAEIDPGVAPSVTASRPGVPPTPVPKGAYAPDIVVLLTDGVNNTGPLPLDAAQQAADRGVRVFTIGFGTANGGPLDPTCAQQFVGREPPGGFGAFGGGGGFGGGAGGFRRGIDDTTLKAVADLTGGTYHPAESAAELESVFASLPTSLITKHEVNEIGFVFVALGALLAAASVLLGRLWRPLP